MSWRKGRRPQEKIWRLVRLRALDRDSWKCRTCGRAGRLEVDHVTPLDDGGELYALSNLQSLCRRCHIEKTRGENTPESPERTAWRDLLADRLASTLHTVYNHSRYDA